MAKAPGSLGDGEVTYNNPTRNEPKRSHQWFMDGTEAELFPNKKQAVEVPNLNSFTGLLNSTISPWGNASGFHSVAGQFTERLFDNETVKTTNFDGRNLPSTSVGNMSMGRKVIEDPFGIDATFGLSISHPLEDPRSGISYGGIRKVKVSQVKDAESFMPVSLGHVYSTGDDTTMSNDHAYGKADVDSVTMGLSFDRGNDSMISMADTINREDTNFISMGQSYNKGVTGDISMGQPYNKGDTSETSMGLVYRENDGSTSIGKDGGSITTMTQSFTREDGNSIAMCVFNGHNSAVSMDQVFSKDDSNAILPIKTFNEGVCNTISINPSGRVDDNGILMGKTDSTDLSMVQSFSKGESNIISFGGLNDDEDNVNPSGRLVCSYDFLMGQPSVQRSEELSEKVLPVSTSDALSSGVQVIAPGDTVSKREQEQKASKKAPPNNFPSNVRSLLSTGMLDGIAVKYVARSREKELHGVIKGSAYLCGCQSCNFSKAINAYEFERHAGCKTKHPNNHIYFENGKTIYGIVQELRNTPQNLLFEVIQTITGSPINQKSFRLWKESFLAAARELRRIYGKEDGKILS